MLPESMRDGRKLDCQSIPGCWLNSGAYSEAIVEGLSLGASLQHEALIATPQSCGMAAQQSSCQCALPFDRHPKAGAAVQKRIAININNELLLRMFISGAQLP